MDASCTVPLFSVLIMFGSAWVGLIVRKTDDMDYLVVWDVDVEGPAFLAGIRIGDQIVSINGTKVIREIWELPSTFWKWPM